MNALENIRIVLVETSHPGNIGAAARAMMNMGLSQLALVKPHTFPSAVATARASGASGILERALVCEDLPTALQDCHLIFGASARSRNISWPELSPEASAEKVLALPGQVAFVFGREHSGLSNEELDLCHFLLKIPTNPQFSSLNVASAVQVLAYEIRKQFLQATPHSETTQQTTALATAQDMDAFYAHLQQTLVDIGFLELDKPRRLVRRLHRLFNRAVPEHKEINMLRGMLKAVQEAIKRDE